MRGKLKKIFAYGLALVMLCTSSPVMAENAINITVEETVQEQTSGDYKYLFNEDNTILITAYNGKSREISIPEQIDGKTVTGIRKDAFLNIPINEVIIPRTVEQIGQHAIGYRILDNSIYQLINEDMVIRSYYATEGQRYAITNNIRFHLIDVIQQGKNGIAFLQTEENNKNPIYDTDDQNIIEASDIVGIWKGTYEGHSGSAVIEREIEISIDQCSRDGKIEGFAAIDNKKNGTYYLEGKVDLTTGDINFSGVEWLCNSSNFDFSSFAGVVDNQIIAGSVNGNTNCQFKLTKKTSNYYSYMIKAEDVPKYWRGEYDGSSGSITVRRDYEISISSIDNNGNVEGIAIISPSSMADSKYGAHGKYKIKGKLNTRTGSLSMQGYEWIQYPIGFDNFSFVVLNGYINNLEHIIEGTSENGIWKMEDVSNLDNKIPLSYIELKNGLKYDYTGKAIKPVCTVVAINGKELKEGTDYTVSYKNNIQPGKATISISGKGTYSGNLTTEFQIVLNDNQSPISDALISKISKVKYTGKEYKPKFTVKYGSKTLVKGKDYTVSYANNIYVGTATVTITGIGDYCGTIDKSFKIVSPGKATIKLNPNGGSVKKKSIKLAKGATYVNLPVPKRKDYSFTGWYTKKKGGVLVNEFSYVKKSTTLYARWKLTTIKYKIVYNKNGATSGSMSKDTMIAGKEKNLKTNAYKRTGYTFQGWSTSKNGEAVYSNKQSVMNLSNKNGATVTLYAVWKAIDYKITYHLNYGKNAVANPATYTIKTSKITLKDPTRTGYIFKGWYTSNSYKTKVTSIAKGSKGNKVFYAKWSAITYTVIYKGNGASSGSMTSEKVKYDNNYYLKTNAFKKTDYTFAGWSTNQYADARDAKYRNGELVRNMASKDGETVTLYALWYSIYDEKTVSLVEPAGSKSEFIYDVLYTDKYFINKNTSDTAESGLAKLSAAAALSTYSGSTNTQSFLKKCGFNSVYKHTTLENDINSSRDDNDNATVYLGNKVLNDGTKLIAVILSGYTRGGYEWISNFNLGTGTIHEGFDIASDKLMPIIYSYIRSYAGTTNVKFWITGHSRGAAMTNLVSMKLKDNYGFDRNQIYAYGFATPRYTTYKKGSYETIVNYTSPFDFVPYVAPKEWDYERNGVDVEFPVGLSGQAYHNYVNYTGDKPFVKTDLVRKELVKCFVALGGSANEYSVVKKWEVTDTNHVTTMGLKDFSAKQYAQNGIALCMTDDANEGIQNMLEYSAQSTAAANLTLALGGAHKILNAIEETHNMLIYLAWIEALYSRY